jgi:hypothetical protein
VRLPAHYGSSAVKIKVPGGSSRFKGVSWHKLHHKWQAYITVVGRRRHLGYFNDERVAVAVYDDAAKQFFGEYALTNNIEKKGNDHGQ